MTSSNRPGQVKIGKAKHEEHRRRQGMTWLQDLTVADKVPFLKVFEAETRAHRHFADRNVDGEWFAVSVEEAKAFLLRLAAAEGPARQELQVHMALAVELGLFAQAENGAPSPVLERILTWKLPRAAVDVQTAVGASLSGVPGVHRHCSLLEKSGFIVILADELVAMDLAEGSPLTNYLDKRLGAGSWEPHISPFVGFERDGRPVKMSTWLSVTNADSETLEWVKSRGNSPRFQ